MELIKQTVSELKQVQDKLNALLLSHRNSDTSKLSNTEYISFLTVDTTVLNCINQIDTLLETVLE